MTTARPEPKTAQRSRWRINGSVLRICPKAAAVVTPVKVLEPTFEMRQPTFDQIFVSARDTVGRTAIPIFGSKEPPGVIGSGFVISSGDDDVLVTAGHVLEECLPQVKEGITTATGWLFKTSHEAVPIGGGITYTRSGNKSFDMGIVKLHDQVRTGAEWQTVPRSIIEAGLAEPLTGLYVVIGFPLSRSKFRPSLKRSDTVLMPIFATPANASKYLELGFDPTHNLLLNYERSNADGSRKFEPIGMSGGPVWGFRFNEGVIQWSLEAMLIERYKNQQVLRCMRVREILRQIDLTPQAKKRSGAGPT